MTNWKWKTNYSC